MPLGLRRKRLALRYVCKVKQEQDHPSHSWIFDQSLVDHLVTTRQSSSQAPCVRFHSWLREADINLDSLATRPRTSLIEPWRMATLRCDLNLMQHPKFTILPEEFRQRALESLALYADYRPFYTDGSKSDEGAGCAFVSLSTTRRFRLPDSISFYLRTVRHLSGPKTHPTSRLQPVPDRDRLS